jgi:hypothetical protein
VQKLHETFSINYKQLMIPDIERGLSYFEENDFILGWHIRPV